MKEMSEDLRQARADMLQLELEDLRFLMGCPPGRRFLRRLFGHCKYHQSVTTQNAKIYAFSAMRDVAVWVRDKMVDTGITPEQLGAVLFGNDGEYRDLAIEEVDEDGR